MKSCNVLIIGGGIAGCTVASVLSQCMDGIILALKHEDISGSNTYFAQGGIVYKGENDSPELLKQDIIYAGAELCYEKAVDILTNQGPLRVKEFLLDELKIPFSTNKKNELSFTEEGAHSSRRIIYAQDRTGKKIIESLYPYIQSKKEIEILNNHTAIDLITLEHHSKNRMSIYKNTKVLGAYLFNNQTRKVETILAKKVILATGGVGGAFLHTTNPKQATGDGIAMAYRAGARIINMQYTQFHPTTLYHRDAPGFLISESVRGEGAVIRNQSGKTFMRKYHDMGDLAPRDIVTRSIIEEMLERDEHFVFLDLSNLDPKSIPDRFPGIYNKCNEVGIDITKEMIPIVPAYHFLCGGIYTNLKGKTSLKNLYAVGEVACNGLHGANRLASTSLLEGLTFGYETALAIKDKVIRQRNHPESDIPEWKDEGLDLDIDIALINQDFSALRNIMWNYVGPIRSHKRLRRAIRDLRNLQEVVEDFYRDSKLIRQLIELRNAIQSGLLIAYQASSCKESLGCHYRVN